MKVLVVDDVGYTRHFHARMLQKFGYDVVIAETGPQALRILERDMSIDVVLTDLMMRDMDGVDLYKAAMRISRVMDGGTAPAPAFILMTAIRPGGNSQLKDIEKLRMAKEIGFLDVLYKPIEPDHLRKVLDSVKLSRGTKAVDVVGVSRQVTETVDRLISAQDFEASDTFSECLHTQFERLDIAMTGKHTATIS
jgi:CheY-like chemotaxis protein